MQFALSIIFVLAATAAIIISSIFCGAGKAQFGAEYFFVCYAVEDNAVSAGSISDAVDGFGGAGYVLSRGDEFYIVVAAYYEKKDAEKIKFSLLKRGLECSILDIETDEYPLPAGKKNKKALFEGNLKTLDSLSRLAYACANKLDTGEYGQTAAKEVEKSLKDGLSGLKKSNPDNCFSKEIARLEDILESFGGYIYSKDMRNFQAAALDVIINIKLY